MKTHRAVRRTIILVPALLAMAATATLAGGSVAPTLVAPADSATVTTPNTKFTWTNGTMTGGDRVYVRIAPQNHTGGDGRLDRLATDLNCARTAADGDTTLTAGHVIGATACTTTFGKVGLDEDGTMLIEFLDGPTGPQYWQVWYGTAGLGGAPGSPIGLPSAPRPVTRTIPTYWLKRTRVTRRYATVGGVRRIVSVRLAATVTGNAPQSDARSFTDRFQTLSCRWHEQADGSRKQKCSRRWRAGVARSGGDVAADADGVWTIRATYTPTAPLALHSRLKICVDGTVVPGAGAAWRQIGFSTHCRRIGQLETAS